MYTIEQSVTFKAWLNDLRDAMGRFRITARLGMAAEGNLGDCEPVGDGVHEMRVHCGPGYQLYFADFFSSRRCAAEGQAGLKNRMNYTRGKPRGINPNNQQHKHWKRSKLRGMTPEKV